MKVRILEIIRIAEQNDGTEHDHSPDYFRGWGDACERIGEEVEELGDGWISVEERLPPRFNRVFVTDGKTVAQSHLNKRSGEWSGVTLLNNEYLEEPTHWQPLPKPPTK